MTDPVKRKTFNDAHADIMDASADATKKHAAEIREMAKAWRKPDVTPSVVSPPPPPPPPKN